MCAVEAADLSADTRLCQWKQTSIVANVDGRLRSQGAGEGAAIGSSCSWQQRQPQALAGQQVRKENQEAPCQAKRQRRVRLNSGAFVVRIRTSLWQCEFWQCDYFVRRSQVAIG